MANTTAIEWTDKTWNPWYGCHKVSQGCKNCYMFRDMRYTSFDPNTVVRSKTRFNDPLKLNEPAKVFTCSWSDFFISEADEWRAEAWDIIRKTPHLTYQILTKRPENIADRLPTDWYGGYPNVWLGISVEDREADYRHSWFGEIPAVVKFVSYEPALGPLSRGSDQLYHGDLTGGIIKPGRIDWVISGGESGPKYRPADPDWFRAVRDYCQENGIAYFHKQNGGSRKIDGSWGGRELDGKTWDQFPR